MRRSAAPSQSESRKRQKIIVESDEIDEEQGSATNFTLEPFEVLILHFIFQFCLSR